MSNARMVDGDKAALLKKLNNKYLRELHSGSAKDVDLTIASVSVPPLKKKAFTVGVPTKNRPKRVEAPASSVMAKKRSVQNLLASSSLSLSSPSLPRSLPAPPKYVRSKNEKRMQTTSNQISMSMLPLNHYDDEGYDKEQIDISNMSKQLSISQLRHDYSYSTMTPNSGPPKPTTEKRGLESKGSHVHHTLTLTSSPAIEWERDRPVGELTLASVLKMRRYPGPSQVDLIRKFVLAEQNASPAVQLASHEPPSRDVYVSDTSIFSEDGISVVDYTDVLESSKSRSAEVLRLVHGFRRFKRRAGCRRKSEQAVLAAFSQEVRSVLLIQSGINKLFNLRAYQRRLRMAGKHHLQAGLVEGFVRLYKNRRQYCGRRRIANIPLAKSERVRLLRLYLWKTEVSGHYQQVRAMHMLRSALSVYQARLREYMVQDVRYRRGRRWHRAVVGVRTLLRLKRLVAEKARRRRRKKMARGVEVARLLEGVQVSVWRRWLRRFCAAADRSARSKEGRAVALSGHAYFCYSDTLARLIAHQMHSSRSRLSAIAGRNHYIRRHFGALGRKSVARIVANELAVLAEHSHEIYCMRRCLNVWLKLWYEGARTRKIRRRNGRRSVRRSYL